MAKTIKKRTDKKNNSKAKGKSLVLTKQHKILWESFILFSVALLVALFFFIHGQEDQSAVSELTNRSEFKMVG
jgi:S-DNA-T family DNA segregation ATPase FtsK/SpoIIIE